MKLLLISLLFTVNIFAVESIKIPFNQKEDFRDNIILELDDESEYSKVTLNNQNWLVKTNGSIVATLLKLQSKEITITHLYQRDFIYLVGLRVVPNK